MYFTFLTFCIIFLFVVLRLRKTIPHKIEKDSNVRINKHGDIYAVIGDDYVFLKFYDIKNSKWYFALDKCETDTVGVLGVKPMRFERVVALRLAHRLEFSMFMHLQVNMVRAYVKIKNKENGIRKIKQ